MSIGAGIASMGWPSITLWVLAVDRRPAFLTARARCALAMGLMAKGADGWVWTVAGGAVSVVLGALALGWPDVTALVLCVLLGLRTMVMGVTIALLGWAEHRVAGDLDPAAV